VRKWRPICCLFILYAFIMLWYLAFVIFGIINFIALLSVHVCSVALYRCVVLDKPFH
jgi:hypothetical protein